MVVLVWLVLLLWLWLWLCWLVLAWLWLVLVVLLLWLWLVLCWLGGYPILCWGCGLSCRWCCVVWSLLCLFVLVVVGVLVSVSAAAHLFETPGVEGVVRRVPRASQIPLARARFVAQDDPPAHPKEDEEGQGREGRVSKCCPLLILLLLLSAVAHTIGVYILKHNSTGTLAVEKSNECAFKVEGVCLKGERFKVERLKVERCKVEGLKVEYVCLKGERFKVERFQLRDLPCWARSRGCLANMLPAGLFGR